MRTQTKQLLIVLVLINLVGAAAYAGLFIWTRRATHETAQLLDELAYQDQKEGRLKSIAELVESTRNERARLSGYFVAEGDVVNTITLFESFLETAGVDEIEVLSVRVVPATFQDTLSVRLQTSGSWLSVVHLLSLLEAVPYAAVLDTVALSYQPPSGEGESLTPGFWRGTIAVDVLMK